MFPEAACCRRLTAKHKNRDLPELARKLLLITNTTTFYHFYNSYDFYYLKFSFFTQLFLKSIDRSMMPAFLHFLIVDICPQLRLDVGILLVGSILLQVVSPSAQAAACFPAAQQLVAVITRLYDAALKVIPRTQICCKKKIFTAIKS